MRDRAWGSASRKSEARKPSARGLRPVVENLEGRVVLNASLAPIPNVTVPATLGYQVSLDGSASGATSQTYSVTSTNPNIKATVATGQFVTLHITHTSSGQGDPNIDGDVTFQLFGDLTPHTVQEIETFVQDGFYNGKVFHRVAPGFPDANSFIVQGGSASGDGSGSSQQPGTPFPDEFNSQLAFTGTYQVAMANSGPETNDTQFFFTASTDNPPQGPEFLNFHHTIFAQVVSGQSVVQQMTQVATKNDASGAKTLPVNPITITKATLSSTNPNGVVHIDATSAVPGESGTVTVTATDPSTNTTATQTFTVNAVTNTNAPERPFVETVPPVVNNTVAGLNQTIGQGQTLKFRIPSVSPTPGDQLTYEVGASFTPATPGSGQPGTLNAIPTSTGTATVDANGVVTFTPASSFSGSFNMLIGVRDQVNRSGVSVTDPANFQWHNITVTVNSSTTPVPLAPIALPLSQQVNVNTPTTFSLQSQNPNTGITQTLTYQIVANPGHGNITGFNPTTGQLTYTPAPNFTGFDRFQYTVTASGGGQSTSVSLPATVTINVANANTGAVRVIGDVLVVTPPPRPKKQRGTDTVLVTENQNTGTLEVTVNGVLDQTQPDTTSINRIVVFGAKASTDITIDPSVTVPFVTLDGGHGGKNILKAGATSTREHGWFGQNTLTGGAGDNQLIGRAGRVRFKPTDTTTQIFAGIPGRVTSDGKIHPPSGTFYKFNGHRIIPIRTPKQPRY